jgi:hypothetical protein
MRSLVFLLLLSASWAQAQAQAKNTGGQKKVYQTTLGGVPNGSIPAERLKTVIDSALTVRDERRKAYPVTDFRVNYFFDTRYEDEETGQTVRKRALRVRDFYDSNRLDADWVGSIRDNARKGDELLFNQIMVRLPNGKKTFVPDLRLKVE